MSPRSHRRNVARKVSGMNHDNCGLVPFEILSPPGYTLEPGLHWEWEASIVHYNQLDSYRRHLYFRHLEGMLDEAAYQLGGFALKDFVFYYADRKSAYTQKVGNLLAKGFRVIIELGMEDEQRHAVGLQPYDSSGLVRTVGNWIPSNLANPIDFRNLYDYLAVCPNAVSEKTWQYDVRVAEYANVIALPPVD